MRKIIIVVAALAVVAGAAALGMGLVTRGERVVQPLAFNHVVHLEDAGLECVECHLNAHTNTFAGIPSKTVCFDCHDSEDDPGDHLEKNKLFAFEDLDEDIPWQRVALTKPDVYFSHRRHVAVAKLECDVCHPDQETLTAPPRTARLVMAMADCVACHAKNDMSEECLHCHR